MSRKPISDKPMSSAERVRKHRANKKAAYLDGLGDFERMVATASHDRCRNICTAYHKRWLDAKNALKRCNAIYGDMLAAMKEIIQLKKENEELNKKIENLETKLNTRPSSFSSGLNLGGSLFGSSQPSLSEDELKLLKHLCHPDKHNGSTAATKAMVLLNTMSICK